jgi:hypothetical protein
MEDLMPEPVILTREEMETLRTILTPRRPLCWYCEFCPEPRNRRKDHLYCRRMEEWQKAVKSARCLDFRLADGKLGTSSAKAAAPRSEQMAIDFSAGYKPSLFGDEDE